MINDIIQLLGVANPQLSIHWTTTNDPSALTANASYEIICNSSYNFLAPLNGYLTKGRELERIILPNGQSPDPTTSFMIRADQQVYLRLTRLYASVLEGKTLNTHLPERPVPAYFVYTGVQNRTWSNSDGQHLGPLEGLVLATTDLQATGTLTIHDQYGNPLDPLAVAAAFNKFMTRFATMQTKSMTTSYAAPGGLTSNLITLVQNATAAQTIYLCTPNGDPVTNGADLFNNLTDTNSLPGWYTTTIGQPIVRKGTAAVTNKIGAATNGKLDNSYLPGVLPNAPKRDFLRVYAVDLALHLLGNAPGTEPSVKFKTLPLVRDAEQLSLLADGTQCLGAIGTINTGGGSPNLLVSPVIDMDFALPQMSGTSTPDWPNMSLPGTGSTGVIPATMKAGFNLSASFIKDTATLNSDVAVVLNCPSFAPGDWVRIYNRVFHEDGSETRGDGAGAIIDASHTAAFRLTDPFSLITAVDHATTLSKATLMLDVLVINRGGKKRLFGNVQCPVGIAAAVPPQLPSGTTNIAASTKQGVSPAGISGTAYAPQVAMGGGPGSFLETLTGAGNPRLAPRYPSMARYDTIAATRNGGAWRAFCGGTILKKDALGGNPFIANPGAPGGREFGSVGVYTAGGLLAYDLARAAFRRTNTITERMGEMISAGTAAAWAPPAPGSGATATWAAATLQTIASHCETAEIGLKFNSANSIPDKLEDFVNMVTGKLGGIPAWLPDVIKKKLNDAIQDASHDPDNQRAYAELYQEIVTSVYGRRDTYWALKQAILSARECIYIQGSLLDHTDIATGPEAVTDLIATLNQQMKLYPRLKVILCLSREIRYGRGYEAFEAHDYLSRRLVVGLLEGMQTDNGSNAPSEQLLVFHPTGFPMRPKELRHQLVIVDDMWALVGSSSFRRRGLMFDGAQDVVAIDKTIVNGKSDAIRNFRVRLLEGHFNLLGATGLTPGLQVRLRDTRESFYAIRELLQSGGAGLISPLWEGNRQNLQGADEALANPGPSVDPTDAMFTALLATLGTAP